MNYQKPYNKCRKPQANTFLFLQYFHVTLQYFHVTLQYFHVTLQYLHVTLQYFHATLRATLHDID